ncbi:putative uncharacterized protein DDB_G0271982 [Actinia tenebrosa]|uniref:Uncharacterized protein n=1 Tax=Actinia tenebrosa TaxID=6105 RepID=A0A6P8IU76_ACTTE|nr:putative uncharacterized protein DDB_G0271982 [Actinia tenebrosa]
MSTEVCSEENEGKRNARSKRVLSEEEKLLRREKERQRRRNLTEEKRQNERQRKSNSRQNFTDEQRQNERQRKSNSRQNFTDEQRQNEREKILKLRQNFSVTQKENDKLRKRRARQNSTKEYLEMDIITHKSSKISGDPKIGRLFSDHAAVFCSLNSVKPPPSVVSRTFRRLKYVDVAAISDDIAVSPLLNSTGLDTLDKLVDCYNTTVSSLVDVHAPLQSKKTVNRPRVPWMNGDIKTAI